MSMMQLATRRTRLILIGLVILSSLAYLGCVFQVNSTLGFPLDDAWIHQTYARNLARYHQLAYWPGQPSAGSTAPLWYLLVSIGYLLPLDPRWWTYLLGAIFLSLTGWTIYSLGLRLFPNQKEAAIMASLFCVMEWHLVWAALSGMETILFTFLSLLLLERYLDFTASAGVDALQIGIIGGLLTLTRPEGLALLGLVALDILRRALIPYLSSPWRKSSNQTVEPLNSANPLFYPLFMLAGFFLLIAPCLAFNLSTAGHPFPNTLYAKQSEYREVMANIPFLLHLVRMGRDPLVGGQVLLIPGFLFAAYEITKQRKAKTALPLSWAIGLWALYAWRLPTPYQHGRYLMPTIPLFVLYAIWGTARLLPHNPLKLLNKVLITSTFLLLIAFWIIGARAYEEDVAIIECEMMETARWLQENVPADELIAVHDIGAIGYHLQRPFVDMAGLVTPEIIPFIRDEGRLLRFLEGQGVAYIVIFPNWYPKISEDGRLKPVHRRSCPQAITMGGSDMVVYKVEWGHKSFSLTR